MKLGQYAGFQKTRVSLKKPNPVGFFGFYWFLGGFIGVLDKQEKIGRIMQNLSNLKP